jgi:hypothetical protein
MSLVLQNTGWIYHYLMKYLSYLQCPRFYSHSVNLLILTINYIMEEMHIIEKVESEVSLLLFHMYTLWFGKLIYSIFPKLDLKAVYIF